VGIVSLAVNWDSFLSGIIPSFIQGVDVVVSHDGEDYTFVVTGGALKYKPMKKIRDNKYKLLGRRFELTQLAGSSKYSIAIYPNAEYFSESDRLYVITPIAISVSVVMFAAVVFYCYDRAVYREAHEKQIAEETKRQFVRFISHEIRTPLNTVHLGTKLLIHDITMMRNSMQNSDLLKTLSDWITYLGEIEASSETSVSVLNDLINYDKISVGGLALDIQPRDFWTIVENSAKPFNIQAVQQGVTLKVDLESAHSTRVGHSPEYLQRLVVLGDDMKLAQVVRNLVSNACKFSPSGGEVLVSGAMCSLARI
jgi:signal transduction histidine kinase